MPQPRNFPQKALRIALLLFLGLAALGLAAEFIFFRSGLDNLIARNSSNDSCSPTLLLGGQSLEIQAVNPPSNGSLALPPNNSGHAYQVKGTDSAPLFFLSSSPEILSAVQALNPGDPVLLHRADCNQTRYQIIELTQTSSALADQSRQSGGVLTIFIPSEDDTAGLLIRAEMLEETLTHIQTPNPAVDQVEVSLLESAVSADGSLLTVKITIQNTGHTKLHVKSGDIDLTSSGTTPNQPVNAAPPLPLTIQPGAIETLTLSFLRPSSPEASLRILTVELIVEGY